MPDHSNFTVGAHREMHGTGGIARASLLYQYTPIIADSSATYSP